MRPRRVGTVRRSATQAGSVGRKPVPARLNFAPVGGFHDAFTRISFEIWYRQRILIVSESGLCGAQPHSRHVAYARIPHAELDKTCLEHMRD